MILTEIRETIVDFKEYNKQIPEILDIAYKTYSELLNEANVQISLHRGETILFGMIRILLDDKREKGFSLR